MVALLVAGLGGPEGLQGPAHDRDKVGDGEVVVEHLEDVDAAGAGIHGCPVPQLQGGDVGVDGGTLRQAQGEDEVGLGDILQRKGEWILILVQWETLEKKHSP